MAENIVTIPWPLRVSDEKAVLKQCEDLIAEGTPEVRIGCGNIANPATRVLNLFLAIASRSSDEPTTWRLIDATTSLVDALRLTGLDYWFAQVAEEDIPV